MRSKNVSHYTQNKFTENRYDTLFQNENEIIPFQLNKNQFDEDKILDQNIIISGDNAKFSCNICGTSLSSNWHLQRHIKNCHEGKRPFICSTCKETFRFENALIKHYATIHGGKMPFRCNICDKTFDKKAQLQYHSSLSHTHQCVDCEKNFRFVNDLENHVARIHKVYFILFRHKILTHLHFDFKLYRFYKISNCNLS